MASVAVADERVASAASQRRGLSCTRRGQPRGHDPTVRRESSRRTPDRPIARAPCATIRRVTALSHRGPALVVALLLTALALVAVGAAAPAAQSAATRSCPLSSSDQDPPGDVPTYNLTLRAKGASCTTAKKVMRAFHKCRAAAGYVCSKKLLIHWSCTGRKSSSTPVLFYANFTCKWGTRRITSRYQQNT